MMNQLEMNLKQGNLNAHQIDTKESILEQRFTSIDHQNNLEQLKNLLKNETNISY